MRNRDQNQYQFTKPPKALLRARLGNIAIVPASMLPLQQGLQELINNLPQGGVFLCHSQANARQREVLDRVGQTFKQQGHPVKAMSVEQISKKP
jgi:hypothetical protein